MAASLATALREAASGAPWLDDLARKAGSLPQPDSKDQRRATLMTRDPHCRNCGAELVYFTPEPHEPLPDNFATLEHVNSRNQSVPRPRRGRLMLWCRRCNQERGAAEQAALGLEELRRRSGRPGGVLASPAMGAKQPRDVEDARAGR